MANFSNKDSFKAHTMNSEDDLQAAGKGGRLNPLQGKEFFNLMRDQMTLKDHARVVLLNGVGVELPTMDLKGRIIELDKGQAGRKRQVDTSQLELSRVRIKASVNLGNSFLEENIEEDGAIDTFAAAFALALGNGAEEMIFESNSLGHAMIEADYLNDPDASASTTNYVKDETFAEFQGMIAESITNSSITVLNGANSADIYSLVVQAKKALPVRYRQNRSDREDLRVYMPEDIVENLVYQLSKSTSNNLGMSIVKDGEGNDMIKVAGVLVVGLGLLSDTPRYSENVTMTGTTAQTLAFANFDADSVVVTPSTLGSTATAAYALTTDYTVNETNGTITRVGAGSITDGQIVKVTYESPPMMFLAPKWNVVIAFENNFKIGDDYDLDTDSTLVVVRGISNFGFQSADAVIAVKNLQDSLTV